MEFVWIPPGKFVMGSNEEGGDEEPAHLVRLDGFWLGRYEVTQGQWKIVRGANPSRFDKGDDYPVETVDWDDVQGFIAALSAGTGVPFRLPTEAEWEYACRAGSSGQEEIELGDLSWFKDNADGSTHPVGQKRPNAWGLHDMLGNVWEWCQDWYADYPGSSQVNPTGPGTGFRRIIRGGAWSSLFVLARPLSRGRSEPSIRDDDLGFRLAISNDPSLRGGNKGGQGMLSAAVSAGRREAVEALIASGADVNARDDEGLAPLHIAVLKGRVDMASLLIAKGADPNAKDERLGDTPLHFAAVQGSTEIAAWLIAKGADIEARNRFGSTPLHEAVVQGSQEIIDRLLAKGADVLARDNNGSSPLHYAAKAGLMDAVRRLTAKGADIEARDQFGDTPLHLAAWEGRKDVVEFLITKGADVRTVDKKGYTPLTYAEAKKYDEIVALLRKHGATR
jgi:ankyrin repeat protein